jgi:hypothetical protein
LLGGGVEVGRPDVALHLLAGVERVLKLPAVVERALDALTGVEA